MRHDKIEVYIHFIWTTWDREPFITPELESGLFPIICAMMERHNARVLGINGVADHLHVLAKFSSTTSLCSAVKDAKGASSRFAHETIVGFKWRPTYAAFSVSRWDVPKILDYIAHQKNHHARGTLKPQLESDGE
jgi:REP element-mobilizing transposase RayT